MARVQRTEQAYVAKIGLYIPDYDTAHSDPCSDCKCRRFMLFFQHAGSNILWR